MNDNQVKILAGVSKVEQQVRRPFDGTVIKFWDCVSMEIKRDPVLGSRDEVMAFGFWCRGQHLRQIKERTADIEHRLGRGKVFHIAPSNIPVLFAYSFAVGMLAGNSNVVRVSPKTVDEVLPLCRLIDRVFLKDEFLKLREQNSVVTYEKDRGLTDEFSADCSLRVIWGGDETIRSVRRSPIPPEAEELVFPDRTSIALLDVGYLSQCGGEELELLIRRFYNDTYGADQNACSSPRIIFWLNGSKDQECCRNLKQRWWEKVWETARIYELSDRKVYLKYEKLCHYAMLNGKFRESFRKDNLLYVEELTELPDEPEKFRGSCGLFFEFVLDGLDQLLPVLNRKIQTLTYLGLDPDILEKLVTENNVRGIDRIVPVGQALNMGTVWDGKNLITQMSREISRC